MNILFIIESREKHLKDHFSDDRLMAEHNSRGHKVWISEPSDLVLDNGKLLILAYLYQRLDTTLSFITPKQHIISSFDLIYYRAMPPVEKDMLHATMLLEKESVHFCNHPSAIRNLNEKLYALQFSEFMPPTLITRHLDDIQAFGNFHGWPLIQKPLDLCQSRGVVKIYTANELVPLDRLMMIQPFLKTIETAGSKRVFILKGNVIGGLSFFPNSNDFRTSLWRETRFAATTLTETEANACKKISKNLVKERLQFAAIDFIEGFLMEINITSPGGIPEWNEQYSTRLEQTIVDQLLATRHI